MKKLINLLVLLILFSCGEEGSGVLPWPPADIYLGTSGGLSISSNNGGSFSNKSTSEGLASTDVRGVFVDDSGKIYVGTASGLSISTDGGSSFVTRTTSQGLGNDTCRGRGNLSILSLDGKLSCGEQERKMWCVAPHRSCSKGSQG